MLDKKMIVDKLEGFVIKNERTSYGGNQVVYKFPNGYGASVVDGMMLHSYPFYLEVAVLKFNGDKFNLTYDTPITNDVEILDSYEELVDILTRIKDLRLQLEEQNEVIIDLDEDDYEVLE